ncbi:hypothetical protein ACFUT3_05415 [Streptomyces cinereoruber]|uniref:hypothetical protein n=1 Tax=Streptomyces cinereoruber TaxID=67260 RepID=UPI0036254592
MSRSPRRRQKPVRMCSDCGQITDQPIVIQRIEPEAGIGWSLYACLTCAPQHMSAFGARILWLFHAADCWECNHEAECPISLVLRRVFDPEITAKAGGAEDEAV